MIKKYEMLKYGVRQLEELESDGYIEAGLDFQSKLVALMLAVANYDNWEQYLLDKYHSSNDARELLSYIKDSLRDDNVQQAVADVMEWLDAKEDVHPRCIPYLDYQDFVHMFDE